MQEDENSYQGKLKMRASQACWLASFYEQIIENKYMKNGLTGPERVIFTRCHTDRRLEMLF